jgi:hypothetical protein
MSLKLTLVSGMLAVPGGPGMETARSAIHDCLHAIWRRTQTAKATGWLYDASCPLDHLTPLLALGLHDCIP